MKRLRVLAIIAVLVGFVSFVAEPLWHAFHQKEAQAPAPPASSPFGSLVDGMVGEVISADPEGRIAGLRLTPDGRHVRWLTDEALNAAKAICSNAVCRTIEKEQEMRKSVRAMSADELGKLLEHSCAGGVSVRCETGLREQNRRMFLRKSRLKGPSPAFSPAFPASILKRAMAEELIAWDPEGRIAGLQLARDGRHLTWLTDDALDAERGVCSEPVCDQIRSEQEARTRVRSMTSEKLGKQLDALCAGGDGRLCEAGIRELNRREAVERGGDWLRKPPSRKSGREAGNAFCRGSLF